MQKIDLDQNGHNLKDFREQTRSPRDLYLMGGSFSIFAIALFLRLWQLQKVHHALM